MRKRLWPGGRSRSLTKQDPDLTEQESLSLSLSVKLVGVREERARIRRLIKED